MGITSKLAEADESWEPEKVKFMLALHQFKQGFKHKTIWPWLEVQRILSEKRLQNRGLVLNKLD